MNSLSFAEIFSNSSTVPVTVSWLMKVTIGVTPLSRSGLSDRLVHKPIGPASRPPPARCGGSVPARAAARPGPGPDLPAGYLAVGRARDLVDRVGVLQVLVLRH